jgi:hypothetical protein
MPAPPNPPKGSAEDEEPSRGERPHTPDEPGPKDVPDEEVIDKTLPDKTLPGQGKGEQPRE